MEVDKLKQLKTHFAYNESGYADIKSDVGEKLVSIRKKKGLTQEEAANIIGISRSALSYYEKGERAVDVEVLYKLCNLYDISIDYLLGMKSTPDTQYDYKVVDELKHFGFSAEAMEKMAGDPDVVLLFNDLLLHKDFLELEYLTHHSRYTRYEDIDNSFRSFLTSKLLYSMIADIYHEWYADNPSLINELSAEEKQEIINQIKDYKEKQEKNTYNDFEYMEEMSAQLEMLYRKLKKYI